MGGDFDLKIELCGQGFFGGIEREIHATTLDFAALNWFTVLMRTYSFCARVAVLCYTNVVSVAYLLPGVYALAVTGEFGFIFQRKCVYYSELIENP